MLPKLEAALRAITAIRESTNYTDRGFYIYYIPPGVLNKHSNIVDSFYKTDHLQKLVVDIHIKGGHVRTCSVGRPFAADRNVAQDCANQNRKNHHEYSRTARSTVRVVLDLDQILAPARHMH